LLKSYTGGAFWIDAEQGIMVMISRISRAAGLEIDSTLKETEQLAEVWCELNSLPPVLIVLDNFPEDESLQPWLPPGNSIHVLVTTRWRDFDFARLTLNFLTITEGIALLNSGTRQLGL
jgi:hypothetical protein